MNPEHAWRKFSDLKAIIKGMGKAAIAFSGGVDSLLLLNAAFEAGVGPVIAVTIDSPFFPRRELDMALELASSLTPEHLILGKKEFSDPRILKNPRERCYYCKKELFAGIIDKVSATYGTACILDGTNYDDLPAYRPGMEALKELEVRSPLREMGFSKDEIRFVLAAKGFASWDKPPSACLATRIPHGETITETKLKMIEAAEDYLLGSGFRQVRVRHHGDTARIEVAPEERASFFRDGCMDEVARKLKTVGYRFVTLDLEGYKTDRQRGDLP
jgi:uncharacterized protein